MAGPSEGQDARGAVERIGEICGGKGRVLILMQDFPDPDALASALALKTILKDQAHNRSLIGYGGRFGRAENRAMAELLDIKVRRIGRDDLKEFASVCLVDAQPHQANNLLSASSRGAEVVIDHHELPKEAAWEAAFSDVRPHYGATATILYEYLVASDTPMNGQLATALFYGIRSDTQELGREASKADIEACQALFSYCDMRKLGAIRRAPVPADYFRMLNDSLESSVVAGSTVISHIPKVSSPDMLAEVAELMLRLRGMRTAVCYGATESTIHLSARTVDARGNVARRMRTAVEDLGGGGGHKTMAGGQVSFEEGELDERLAEVFQRILEAFAGDEPPRRLLDG